MDENEDQIALDPAEVLQAFRVGPAQIERTALVKRDQLTLMGPIQQGAEALVTFLYTTPFGDIYVERARFYVEQKDSMGHGVLRPSGDDPRLPPGFRVDIPSPSYENDPTRSWLYLFELMPDRTLESQKLTYFQEADMTDHRVNIFSLHALHAAMRGTPNRTVEVVAEFERVLGLVVAVGGTSPPENDTTPRSAVEAAYLGRMMSQFLNMVRYDRDRVMEGHVILIEMFNDTLDQIRARSDQSRAFLSRHPQPPVLCLRQGGGQERERASGIREHEPKTPPAAAPTYYQIETRHALAWVSTVPLPGPGLKLNVGKTKVVKGDSTKPCSYPDTPQAL